MAMVGHLRVRKTLELVFRSYWQSYIHNHFDSYIRICDACCWSKSPQHRPYGLLQPLLVLDIQWKSISLDFITDLPSSKGFEVIITVLDQFMEMGHFLPYTTTINSQMISYLVMCEVFGIMVFLTTSLVTEAHNSSQKFRNTCLGSSNFIVNSL